MDKRCVLFFERRHVIFLSRFALYAEFFCLVKPSQVTVTVIAAIGMI